MSHYGHRGAVTDVSEKWLTFLKMGIEQDLFDFMVFGDSGQKEDFFGKKLGKKIGNMQWSHVISYPSVMRCINPDFVIAPLADVAFNKAKSNVKMLEAAALGAVFIGEVFEGSPYEGILDCQKVTKDDTPKTIMEKFKGGPVGLDTLSAALGEDSGTIEDVYEPYLVQNASVRSLGL